MSAEHGKPPVFRTWKGWYWLVMGTMLAQLFMYLWITYSYQ
jgi:hypothetical protein